MKIVLTATDQALYATTAAAPATAQPTCHVCWSDRGVGSYVPGSFSGELTDTTELAIVPAPDAATQRMLASVLLHNADTVAATITLALGVDTDRFPLFSRTLQPGETWIVGEDGCPAGQRFAGLCQARLSLEAAVPVSTSDQTGKTVLRLEPLATGRLIDLSDGERWYPWELAAALTIDTTGLSAASNYDVYLAHNGGTPALAFHGAAWSSGTARGYTLGHFRGRPVHPSDDSKLWLGTVRTDASTQFNDAQTARLVWNAYNQVEHVVRKEEATANWTRAAGTFGAYNNSTANRIELLDGLGLGIARLTMASLHIVPTGTVCNVGVGLDSTTTNDAHVTLRNESAGAQASLYALFEGRIGLGYHFLQATERAESATATFYGKSAIANGLHSGGLHGTWSC